MWVDNGVQDCFGEEDPSLHHLIKEMKRQVHRTVHMILDKNGSPQTSSLDILRVFAEYFKSKYDTIPVSGECMKRLMDCNLSTVPDAANLALEEPDQAGRDLSGNKNRETPIRLLDMTAYIWNS